MKSALVLKPKNVTFEQAASAPVAALTALQGLRDKGHVQPGQQILINGASGGIGTFAVQIAKVYGAVVTGVCSTRNMDMVAAIGADRVIDYTQEDFTQGGRLYDVILDAVGNRPLSALRRALMPGGILVMAGAQDGVRTVDLLGRLIAAVALSRIRTQKMIPFIARSNKEDLTLIGDLLATGKITPVIDRRYALTDVPEAIRYQRDGHARGKVVITFD